MSEINAALFMSQTRQGVDDDGATRHAHSTRVFRLSRPGGIGTLALLPGDSRTTVVWRSNR